MKTYIDEGLDKDSKSANLADGASGSYQMPEFQKLIATAGKGLHRCGEIFYLWCLFDLICRMSSSFRYLIRKEEKKGNVTVENRQEMTEIFMLRL